MTSRDRNTAIIFLSTVAVRLLFHFYTGYTADDAFITFRYADNIIGGEGFVYNSGERVLGTTTPLFTLVLVLFGLIGMEVSRAALLVSLLCCGTTAVIIYRFADSLRFTRWSLLPVVLYILFPRLLPTDTGGMETALFTLLLTAAFYYQHRQMAVYGLAMATLAAATRPEGYLVLGILLVYNVIKRPGRLVSLLSVPAPILLAWVAFATLYFGSPIPNSVPAKLALYSRFGSMSPWDNLLLVIGFEHPLSLPLLALAIIGGWWLNKRQNYGLLEIIFMMGMVGGLAFSSTHMFLWYISPIYPIYLLFASAALPMLSERANLTGYRLTVVSQIALVTAAVVMSAAIYKPASYYRGYQHNLEIVHKAIGLYLRGHTDKDAVVAAEDIGYLGYFSERKIIDRDGLVSPEVVPYNRDGRYLEVIEDMKPDWVVASPQGPNSPFIDSLPFTSKYELREAFFPATGVSEYRIFARRN